MRIILYPDEKDPTYELFEIPVLTRIRNQFTNSRQDTQSPIEKTSKQISKILSDDKKAIEALNYSLDLVPSLAQLYGKPTEKTRIGKQRVEIYSIEYPKFWVTRTCLTYSDFINLGYRDHHKSQINFRYSSRGGYRLKTTKWKRSTRPPDPRTLTPHLDLQKAKDVEFQSIQAALEILKNSDQSNNQLSLDHDVQSDELLQDLVELL